jgi:hypothetical protein
MTSEAEKGQCFFYPRRGFEIPEPIQTLGLPGGGVSGKDNDLFYQKKRNVFTLGEVLNFRALPSYLAPGEEVFENSRKSVIFFTLGVVLKFQSPSKLLDSKRESL